MYLLLLDVFLCCSRKELSEEERRLELMMEQERQNALKKQEKQKEKEFMKRQLYVKSILEQIKDNQLEKEIDLERIEEVELI